MPGIGGPAGHHLPRRCPAPFRAWWRMSHREILENRLRDAKDEDTRTKLLTRYRDEFGDEPVRAVPEVERLLADFGREWMPVSSRLMLIATYEEKANAEREGRDVILANWFGRWQELMENFNRRLT